MKIFYIGVLKNDHKPGVELSVERDLTSWNYFIRGKIQEGLDFGATTVAERTAPGTRQSVTEKDQPNCVFHAYARSEGVCGVVVSDKEYPEGVAQSLLSKVLDEFTTKHPRSSYASLRPPPKDAPRPPPLAYSELKEYIVKYQNPAEADPVMKIQGELDATKQVLHRTMEQMLERGEKIEDLVAKSDVLSSQSKMFYTQAKKQNSCCVVM